MNELRKELINQIHGFNTALTDEYLNSISTIALINNTHPLYREGYSTRYKILQDEEN